MGDKKDFEEIRKLAKKDIVQIVELLADQNNTLISEAEGVEESTVKMEEELKELKREKRELLSRVSELEEEKKGSINIIEGLKKEKDVYWKESGNLAEYAANISQLFETTQRTADVYLSNIKRRNEKKEQEAQEIVKEAQKEVAEIMEEARIKEAEVKASRSAILSNLQQEIDSILEDFKEDYQQLHQHEEGE